MSLLDKVIAAVVPKRGFECRVPPKMRTPNGGAGWLAEVPVQQNQIELRTRKSEKLLSNSHDGPHQKWFARREHMSAERHRLIRNPHI